MDKLDRYREILTRIVNDYASVRYSHGDIQAEPVIDRERDHYEVMHIGWNKRRRVHGTVIHLDIRDGKMVHDGRDGI